MKKLLSSPNLSQQWKTNKSGILLACIVTLLIFLPAFLFLLLRNPDNTGQQAIVEDGTISSVPTPTAHEPQQIASFAQDNCTAHAIACDTQFQDNKNLACGSFKSVVIDELLKRDESPCKGLERSYVEAQLNEACQKGCVAPTATTTPRPTVTNTPSPTQTTPAPETFSIDVEFALPGIGKSQFENNNPQHPEKKVIARLHKGSDNSKVEEIEGKAVYDAQSGTFKARLTFNAPLGVAYYTIIKTESSLSKRYSQTPTVLAVGDITGDNAIDIADYNLFLACYQSLPLCSDQSKKLADFTDNGSVYIDDLNVLQRAYSVGRGDLVGE